MIFLAQSGTCIPTAAGRAGLFLYWLGSFAYPRCSKNERNAVISAVRLRPKVFTAARYDHPIMPDPGMQSAETMLHGAVLVLLRFDVCEAIRLDRLRELIRARTVEQPSPKHPARGMFATRDRRSWNQWRRWCWRAANGYRAKSSTTITAC
jgi:hypothetical protein